MNDYQFQILLEGTATLLGFGLAYLGTYQYERNIRKMEETERRKSILSAIIKELDLNKKMIEKMDDHLEKNSQFNDTLVFFNASFQSAIGNGDFSLLDSDTQIRISDIYMSFEVIERLTVSILGCTIQNIYDGQVLLLKKRVKGSLMAYSLHESKLTETLETIS
jgi:hypothetical protein